MVRVMGLFTMVVNFKYGACAVNFCCKGSIFIRIVLCKIEDFVTKTKTGAQEAHGVDGPNSKTTLDVGLRVRFGP